MIWTDEFSIGNENIDNEHKKLIGIINDLVDLVELNGSRLKFAEILSNMTDYVLIHLKKEEKYIKKIGYPKLKEHIQEHRDYSYKIAMFNVTLLSSNPPDPKDIIEYLEKWWEDHILNFDMDYENYKNSIGSDVKYPILWLE